MRRILESRLEHYIGTALTLCDDVRKVDVDLNVHYLVQVS